MAKSPNIHSRALHPPLPAAPTGSKRFEQRAKENPADDPTANPSEVAVVVEPPRRAHHRYDTLHGDTGLVTCPIVAQRSASWIPSQASLSRIGQLQQTLYKQTSSLKQTPLKYTPYQTDSKSPPFEPCSIRIPKPVQPPVHPRQSLWQCRRPVKGWWPYMKPVVVGLLDEFLSVGVRFHL